MAKVTKKYVRGLLNAVLAMYAENNAYGVKLAKKMSLTTEAWIFTRENKPGFARKEFEEESFEELILGQAKLEMRLLAREKLLASMRERANALLPESDSDDSEMSEDAAHELYEFFVETMREAGEEAGERSAPAVFSMPAAGPMQ